MKKELLTNFFNKEAGKHLIKGDKVLFLWPEEAILQDQTCKKILEPYEILQLPNMYYLPFFRLGRDFDAIICFDMLHRVPDPYMLLMNMLQCIKPGGVIFLNTKKPNNNINKEDFFVIDYIYLVNIFKKLGFQIIQGDENGYKYIIKKQEQEI